MALLKLSGPEHPGPRRLPWKATPEAEETPEVTTQGTRPSWDVCGLDSGPAQPSPAWANQGTAQTHLLGRC